jgi:hypothetical protein
MRKSANSIYCEELVTGPVQQRALKRADFAENGIGVVYGGDHIAFGCEILCRPGEERARPRIAVRHNDQWKPVTASGPGTLKYTGL